MASICYSKAAISDLEQIGDYIADELQSPKAALKLVDKIQDSIDRLADFPLMGSPLSATTGMDTDYRFLVCGNYLAFYRAHGNDVLIDRIMYGKRDYVAILFGNVLFEEPE